MPSSFYIRMARLRATIRAEGPAGMPTQLNEVQAEAPETAAAWFQLGEAWLSCGRYDEAEAALIHSMRLDPAGMPAQLFLALANLDRGEFAPAVRQIDTVLQRRLDHEFARSLLDYATWLETGKREPLRRLATSPFVYDMHLGGRVLFHVERKRPKDSKGRLADLFAEMEFSLPGKWMHPLARIGYGVQSWMAHPFSSERRFELRALVEGMGHVGCGRPGQAAALAVVVKKPSSYETATGLAEVMLAGGEIEKVSRWLDRMVEMDRSMEASADYQMLRGAVLAEQGRWRDAEACLTKVPDDPFNFFPYYYRGLCTAMLDRPVDARRWFARALEICSIHVVHRRLARLLEDP